MKKNLNNRVNPVGLKGNEINERMKELMGITSINENRKTSVVELTKMGPDGNAYAIVRENHEYYIKIAAKKENLVAEDFKYIGGLKNKKSEAYPTYAKAIKHLNLKFNSLKEVFNKDSEFNVFENDNLLNETGNGAVAAGFSSMKGNGFSGEGNLDNNKKLEIEGEVKDEEVVEETLEKEEDELTEVEKAVDDMQGMKGLNINEKEEFAGYSDCCNSPVYGETSMCSKCGEKTEVKAKDIKEAKKLSIVRALTEMDAIIDSLTEGKVKKKVYTIK